MSATDPITRHASTARPSRICPAQPRFPRHRARVGATLAFVLAAALTSAGTATAASSHTWDRLAECESGQRWDLDTGNGYYGGLQFHPHTWRAYGGEEFAPNAHLASRLEQMLVAERLLTDRGWAPWPGCSAKLGLTAQDAAGDPLDGLDPEQAAAIEAAEQAVAQAQQERDSWKRKVKARSAHSQTLQRRAERRVIRAEEIEASAAAWSRRLDTAEAHERAEIEARIERKLAKAERLRSTAPRIAAKAQRLAAGAERAAVKRRAAAAELRAAQRHLDDLRAEAAPA